MHKLTDLREILRYVPNYREKVFVVAVDGEVVEFEQFQNLLLDIALLRSLNIRVVLVHGAGHQIRRAAEEEGKPITNSDGTGVTDAYTLRLALNVSNRITHEILEGLAACDLRGACTNAVVAHPAGILRGVDMQNTGKVDRIDSAYLRTLLDNGIVPIVQPLGFDGEGHTFRLNSDAVAMHVALSLRAIKLVFITSRDGIERGGRLLRQLSVNEAEEILKQGREQLATDNVSKLEHAFRACEGGIERVHIINGRTDEGLLSEVFSPTGIGTLVYVNEYQSVRQAKKRDARTIQKLIEPSVKNDELLKRSRATIEKHIGDYYLFEIDGNPVGCVALHPYPEERKAELACLSVSDSYENRGIGRKLMNFVEKVARERGFKELFLLSTQAFNYFQQKGGFQEATPGDLPPARRQQWEASKRNSRVLVKPLQNAGAAAPGA
ncbi:MAG: amino-acid N-acetyltransferase [Planctomycetota bacterium]|nr:amino-acid N-acetyltransferase [Planctomycetota bacterium]